MSISCPRSECFGVITNVRTAGCNDGSDPSDSMTAPSCAQVFSHGYSRLAHLPWPDRTHGPASHLVVGEVVSGIRDRRPTW